MDTHRKWSVLEACRGGIAKNTEKEDELKFPPTCPKWYCHDVITDSKVLFLCLILCPLKGRQDRDKKKKKIYPNVHNGLLLSTIRQQASFVQDSCHPYKDQKLQDSYKMLC